MILTTDYISKAFDKYNAKYFNGELVKPLFKIISTSHTLGQCCRKNNVLKGTYYIIKISNKFDRNEHQYDNTIIHEMIHLYTFQKSKNPKDWGHGNAFYALANRINKDGWEISRCSSIDGIGLTDDTKVIYNVFAFYSKTNKRHFLMVSTPNKVEYFKGVFKRNPDYYSEVNFYQSKDSKLYASMPKCRASMRGKTITKADLENIYLKSAI